MSDQIPFSFDTATVTEITNRIKRILEGNFSDLLVEGEISNVSRSRNGHYYFTVKDSGAQLPCVIWRSTADRLGITLTDGQQVVLGGDIQVYAPHGRYQMIVSLVQQAGVGKLQQKFEELKKKLEEEGLFEAERKKPIPPYPMRVGVITSSTGAAFQDIRSTFEQRWPVATLLLYHASVQGVNAAPELVHAIDYFNNQKEPVDLIIIGRGGGSLEDLWPFNEEAVARSIYKSTIPVISAVGHEVDFSISDFVADERAATPTQAVIIAAPDINELRYQIEDYTSSITQNVKQKLEARREYVNRLAHSHALLVVQEKIRYHRKHLSSLQDQLRNRFGRMLSHRREEVQNLTAKVERHNPKLVLQRQQNRLETARERLQNRYEKVLNAKKTELSETLSLLKEVNPKAPLERGFTRILQKGTWIRSAERFDPAGETEIEWNDGVRKTGKR
ncbi:MAG: exodeoxyribonuclease VII large subunit [Balneolaceae bacterium]|nr:exodeoxyribonuclease VII large subunit [Balneolaceae bacterium]MCH8547230.1 exodeoxyribonuclease VII large subunit [Balneolaceae bacterium]